MKKIFYKIIRSPKLILLTILIFLILLVGVGLIYYWQIGSMEFYRRHHASVQFVKKMTNLLYFPYLFSSSKLERYNLIIAKEDLDFLNSNLPPTYAGNLLEEKYRKKVDAKFIAGSSDEYNVKVRYHGDTDGHWRDSKKSWVIEFQDKYFQGMREIHLVIPVDRNYLLEEFNFYRAKKAGLITTSTKFVNLSINNRLEGVYWQFESWNQEMLEKQNLSAETKLYGGINDYELSDNNLSDSNFFSDLSLWQIYSPKNDENYLELSLLLDILNNPDDQYFYQHIGEIIDLENFYQWQINQYLTSSVHQTGGNMRFYFDIIVGKFKFIPWDVSMGDIYSLEKGSNQLIQRVLSNPEFLNCQNELLKEYVNNPENLADDLKFYDELDKLTKNDFLKDLNKLESNLKYRQKIKAIRNKIIDRFNYLKNNL